MIHLKSPLNNKNNNNSNLCNNHRQNTLLKDIHIHPMKQGHFPPSDGQGHFPPSDGQGPLPRHLMDKATSRHLMDKATSRHLMDKVHLLSSSRSMPSQDASTLQDVLYSLSTPNCPQLSGSHEGATFPPPPRPEMPPPTLTGIGAPGMYPSVTSMPHPLALTHSSWVPSMTTHTDSHMQSLSTHLPQPAYPVERQQSAGPMLNTHLSITTTAASCNPFIRQQSSKDSGIVDYSSVESGANGGLRSQRSHQLPHQGSSLEPDLFQGTAENHPTFTTQKSHPLYRQECVVGGWYSHTSPCG